MSYSPLCRGEFQLSLGLRTVPGFRSPGGEVLLTSHPFSMSPSVAFASLRNRAVAQDCSQKEASAVRPSLSAKCRIPVSASYQTQLWGFSQGCDMRCATPLTHCRLFTPPCESGTVRAWAVHWPPTSHPSSRMHSEGRWSPLSSSVKQEQCPPRGMRVQIHRANRPKELGSVFGPGQVLSISQPFLLFIPLSNNDCAPAASQTLLQTCSIPRVRNSQMPSLPARRPPCRRRATSHSECSLGAQVTEVVVLICLN